jgi:DNA-binding NarL/FixJ family response regulator
MSEVKRKPGRASKAPRFDESGAAVPLAVAEKVIGLSVEEARDLYARLTRRQREVAELMARGIANREIANKLGISVKTLDIHRCDVYDKLATTTSAGVAAIVFMVALADASA